MAAAELRVGDIFDGPSDMIVLPCSTSGTITSFVNRKLEHYNIKPRPASRSELGDVQVHDFVGGENIAQFVAYAVSVDRNHSSLEAIERIGRQLGELTKTSRSIRRVSAPLLGKGAGGLGVEAVAPTLARAFESSSHRDAALIISVLHEADFELVRRGVSSGSHLEQTPKR